MKKLITAATITAEHLFIVVIIIIIIIALQAFVGPWPLFQFLDPIHSR
jgi:hypothetical protein